MLLPPPPPFQQQIILWCVIRPRPASQKLASSGEAPHVNNHNVAIDGRVLSNRKDAGNLAPIFPVLCYQERLSWLSLTVVRMQSPGLMTV